MIFTNRCHYTRRLPVIHCGRVPFASLTLPLKLFLVLSLLFPVTAHADQTVIAQPVTIPPLIDGAGNDRTWRSAEAIITHDQIADIDITLTAVYTETEIFFRISFPDPDESRTHKSWVWDRGRELYGVGYDREDVFIFKWNMNETPTDLSIYADNPYMADIWFWKACRTDPVGSADDKLHILSQTMTPRTKRLTSKSKKTMYLVRREDSGRDPYAINFVVDFQGDTVPRYIHQTPTGSRGDIEAKGSWNNGVWTVEFARTLITGNEDDIQFDKNKTYQFGLSRYEIAGRPKNSALSQPKYGQGDISETLFLEFAPRKPASK